MVLGESKTIMNQIINCKFKLRKYFGESLFF